MPDSSKCTLSLASCFHPQNGQCRLSLRLELLLQRLLYSSRSAQASFIQICIVLIVLNAHPLPFEALLSLALILLSCLLILSFLSTLRSFLTSPASPILASFFSSTSTSQSSSPSLFLPLYPHLGTHSPFSSSYTSLPSRRFGAIPFFAANRSHFVCSLAAGTGFSRGSGVVGAGSSMCTPSGVLRITHVVRSWFSSDCAQSRAVDWRSEGEGFGGSGFVSEQRRCPRSKVYGIGLVTVTDGLLDDPLRSI